MNRIEGAPEAYVGRFVLRSTAPLVGVISAAASPLNGRGEAAPAAREGRRRRWRRGAGGDVSLQAIAILHSRYNNDVVSLQLWGEQSGLRPHWRPSTWGQPLLRRPASMVTMK